MNARNAGRKPNLAVVDPKHPEQKARQTAIKEARKDLDKLQKTPPKYLMPDAKRLWKKIVPQLESVGLVTVLDQTNLELFCTQYAEYIEAVESVKQHGSVYMNDDGDLKKNPSVNIIDSCSKSLRSLGMTLGIDFSSHSQQLNVEGTSGGKTDINEAMKQFGG